MRRFPPYHEIPERRDGRTAVVTLYADGKSAKAISGYLRVGTSTIYRILRRWAEEGPDGLSSRPHGRPPGVRKVTSWLIPAFPRIHPAPERSDGAFPPHASRADDQALP